jgi:hypothetical protein
MSDNINIDVPSYPNVIEVITPDLINELIERKGTLVLYLEDETALYWNAEAALRKHIGDGGMALNGKIIGLRDPSSKDAALPKLKNPQVQITSFAANYIAIKELGQVICVPELLKHVVVDLNLNWNPTQIESGDDFSPEEQGEIKDFAKSNNLEIDEASELCRICDVKILTPKQLLELKRIIKDPYYTDFAGIRFMLILLKNAPDTKITVCSSVAHDTNILGLILNLCNIFDYPVPEFVQKDRDSISMLFTQIAENTQFQQNIES